MIHVTLNSNSDKTAMIQVALTDDQTSSNLQMCDDVTQVCYLYDPCC